MKNGSELVWSMWECERRIECTSTWLSMDSTWESEPASRAIVPLINRQVIRQSRLSPPNPPSTWRRIDVRNCIPKAKRPAGAGRLGVGMGQSLEPGADPEVGAEAAQLVLQVPLL